MSTPEARARVALACAATLLLSACAAVPPAGGSLEPLYRERMERLSRIDEWILDGRLAINDGKDGGSGELRWHHAAASTRMDFHGALGRGAWRLQADPGGVELTFADGRQRRAASIDELVRSEAGWPVPVQALSWWVRGLAAPGEPERLSLGEQGLPSELQQNGWSVEYGRYSEVGEEALPMRMTARQGDRTVKLVVRKWQLAVPDDDR